MIKPTRSLLGALALLLTFASAASADELRRPTNYEDAFDKFRITSDFDWGNAYLSMILARLTYLTWTSDDDDFARDMGLNNYVVKTARSRKTIIASNDKMTIIAVEGLNLEGSGKDRDRTYWKSGLTSAEEICIGAKKSKKKDCKIIGSFRTLAKAHYDNVRDAGLHKTKPLFLVGHSFGGWAAIYMGARMKADGYNVKAIYTFGTPRFGNEKAKDRINRLGLKIYRFIVKDDYAADWPNQNSYWPGARIIYMKKNDVNTNKDKSAIKEGGFDIFKSEAHSPGRYINRVYKFAKEKRAGTWDLPNKGEYW